MTNTDLARKHWNRAFDYLWRDRRKAIKEARTAIALDPTLARPHWLLGQVYLIMPPIDRESALREFRELVRKEPMWPHGQFSLGTTLVKQGRVDEAIKPLREALRLAPDAVWARVELSRCLLKRDGYREAITALRGRPSLYPFYTIADAYLMLAETLANSSNYGIEQAREVWEQILTFDDSIPANRVAGVEAQKRLAESEKKLQ